MNKQLADFAIPSNLTSSQMPRLTSAKVNQAQAKNYQAPPQGPNIDFYNPMQDADNNMCARSMNSEAFSHFSLPSNNLLKVNAFQAQQQQPPKNLLNTLGQEDIDSSSQFSSALRSKNTQNKVEVNLRPPSGGAPLQMCQSIYEEQGATSYYQSQLTSESFQQAEYNALEHEELAKKRLQDKEQKLLEFQNKTKANAMKKMREDAALKTSQADKKKQEAKEKQLKAKEYAKKQREMLNKKKGKAAPIEGKDSEVGKDSQIYKDIISANSMNGIVNIENNPNSKSMASINSLSKISMDKGAADRNKSNNVIIELSEENTSQTQSLLSKKPLPPRPKKEKVVQKEEKLSENPVIKTYQRIDQQELEKLGLGHKSELAKESSGFKSLHNHSMLQRFRSGKNYRAVDKYRSQLEMDHETKEKVKAMEDSWYRENVQTNEEREMEQKSRVEKERYVAALKALVQEKGQKKDPENGEIPPLCSCGAMTDNIRNAQKNNLSKTSSQQGNLEINMQDGTFQMCASNCQFYKNEKGYVRALRDVLHSINQFK